MGQKHYRLSKPFKLFVNDFIQYNCNRDIDNNSYKNTAQIYGYRISGGTNGCSYVFEEEFKILESNKLAAKDSSFEALIFKCQVNTCHWYVGKRDQNRNARKRKHPVKPAAFYFF